MRLAIPTFINPEELNLELEELNKNQLQIIIQSLHCSSSCDENRLGFKLVLINKSAIIPPRSENKMDGGLAVRCGGERGPISSHHWRGTPLSEGRRQAYAEETLPIDPRNWTRADVSSWLTMMAAKHRIPDPLSERFPMNGKGLCLMTVDMYLNRVPLGGKLLYRDFQIRLAKAMHLSV